MAIINHRIAILATGDEIINGDILNTNTPFIAQELFNHQLIPGRQMTVSDDLQETENAILNLLSDHAALITIGGLGPTSDDLTRFALAKALRKELFYHEPSWQHIVTRLSRFNMPVPETNKQQCLFPMGAEIIPNENGTANGCYISHEGKSIFMLPGPPREIKPIFLNAVLPKLMKNGFAANFYYHSWLLLGIGEGQLAEQIEALSNINECNIGYRADIPYIELKLLTESKSAFDAVKATIMQVIQPYLVSENRQTASQLLYQFLVNYPDPIAIVDHATCGLLQTTLSSPKTRSKLHFTQNPAESSSPTKIYIHGLKEYWQQQATDMTDFHIKVIRDDKCLETSKKVPLRGRITLTAANEIICWELLQLLK